MKGKHHSEETKRKISKTWNKWFKNATKKQKENMTKNWLITGLLAAQKANPSSIEKIVCKILDSLNIDYKTQVSFNSHKFIVDIFIPSKRLIIECNGTYWHNYDIFPKRKIRDNALEDYAKENNYRLIWLWEDEIRENSKQKNSKSSYKAPDYLLQKVFKECFVNPSARLGLIDLDNLNVARLPHF